MAPRTLQKRLAVRRVCRLRPSNRTPNASTPWSETETSCTAKPRDSNAEITSSSFEATMRPSAPNTPMLST